MSSITRVICLFVLVASISMAPSLSAREDPVLLVVGDSLSAAYNMPLERSWPRLLEGRLRNDGQKYQVVNASITGDTSQGGLTRLPRLLERHSPDWVIIELGGNDGLRGLSLEVTRDNLEKMILASQAEGARVLLTGIMLPPNYGAAYTDRFQALYADLSERHGTLLVPFFMEGVALTEGMMQDDGIHPTEQAQSRLLDNVWTVLGPALQKHAD